MKKLFTILILAVSCTQDQTLSEPEISFIMNGGDHKHTGPVVSAAKNVNPSIFYLFSGVTNGSNTIQIVIPTPGDTLKNINYRNVQGSGTTLSVNGEIYSYFQAGDFLDVTFTGYQNGVVNGFFSGKVSKMVSTNPLVFQQSTLTNGEIKNVKIIY